jgi:hypothetical protein
VSAAFISLSAVAAGPKARLYALMLVFLTAKPSRSLSTRWNSAKAAAN